MLLLLMACSSAQPAGALDWEQAIETWHYTDPLPDLPVTDHTGAARHLHEWHGEHVLIGFIYTACPDAQACPMTTARMAQIQREVPEGTPLRFLSLTLDPARDTPETLSAYAATHSADLATWTFATGEPELMTDGLPSLFNVLSLPDADGTLDHTIKLTLIGPDGRHVAEWKDNAVTTADVLSAMR